MLTRVWRGRWCPLRLTRTAMPQAWPTGIPLSGSWKWIHGRRSATPDSWHTRWLCGGRTSRGVGTGAWRGSDVRSTHPDEPCRHARNDTTGRHVLGHNRTGPDDGVVADRHTLQNDRPASHPHPVAQPNWLGYRGLPTESMLIRVHDHHIPGDLTVAADNDLTLSDDLGIAIQVGPVT